MFGAVSYITHKELLDIIREAVKAEVAEQLQQLLVNKAAPEWHNATAAAKKLSISRATLHSWFKDKKLLRLHKYMRMQGRRKVYDVAGIQGFIQDHPVFFGRGRDYDYKAEADKTYKLVDRKL